MDCNKNVDWVTKHELWSMNNKRKMYNPYIKVILVIYSVWSIKKPVLIYYMVDYRCFVTFTDFSIKASEYSPNNGTVTITKKRTKISGESIQMYGWITVIMDNSTKHKEVLMSIKKKKSRE